jgi:hypothetical protein
MYWMSQLKKIDFPKISAFGMISDDKLFVSEDVSVITDNTTHCVIQLALLKSATYRVFFQLKHHEKASIKRANR